MTLLDVLARCLLIWFVAGLVGLPVVIHMMRNAPRMEE